MTPRPIPELLAPAGSLDAVRAAFANGADAVYLGAERFNARDEGAQLTMAEVAEACRIAHGRGGRIYLTLNTLVKPAELAEALAFLGEAIDQGIDAAIVQDIGLVRLIRRCYPALEIHGSTQMTVHDELGALVVRELGVQRIVLARENTLDDIRRIRGAVPDLGLESFVHGALCISYSGQCFMSGMISERSANRGSCAQSCRKDYVLNDDTTGAPLDRGFLLSTKDLAAHDHLAGIAEAGIVCLKVEGRKKRPEYVATVTRGYRSFLDRVGRGEPPLADAREIEPLVQIFSRGFTGGMYGGRAGRGYVTRSHPDNRGIVLGTVVSSGGGEIVVDADRPIAAGDGLGFDPPEGARGPSTGFTVAAVRELSRRHGIVRQAVRSTMAVPAGWTVTRSADAALLERARASYAGLAPQTRGRKTRIDVRLFGAPGTPLKAIFTAEGEEVTVRSERPLVPAEQRALDARVLREQLGRMGETPFALTGLDISGLAPGLFLPVSELNALRRAATEALMSRRDWARSAALAEREERIRVAVAEVSGIPPALLTQQSGARGGAPQGPFVLSAEVYRIEDARAAADAGATEITLDPFLRHPATPQAHLTNLAAEMRERGIAVRLRTPTIVRPTERTMLDKWLVLELPVVSGHLGLVAHLARAGRDVVADYAVNCFNQHTAAELFRLGVSRIVLSVELTLEEMAAVSEPWRGAGFDTVIYGRPEGMTIEHCVLSAAFDREPATCRDLCVQKHPLVSLTDPAGYTFPLATDSACRNRLLHSRPIEGSEYLGRLWAAGVRGYRMLFNMPDDPVAELVSGYRQALEALAAGERPDAGAVRALVGEAFTRGHFARAV